MVSISRPDFFFPQSKDVKKKFIDKIMEIQRIVSRYLRSLYPVLTGLLSSPSNDRRK